MKVLFISHVDSYFSGFVDLIRLLQINGDDPCVLFPASYPNLGLHIDVCRKENIRYSAAASPASTTKSESLLARIKASLSARSRNAVLAFPGIGYLVHLTIFSRKLRAIRQLLHRDKPDLLALGGDIVGHDMALYIKAGHELGIPSVLLPGWMASAREPAELNLYNPRFFFSRPLNALLGYYAPNWIYTHKGRALVRQPAQEACALMTLGLAPPLPWVLHSGFADAIAVESEAARKYGIDEGLSSTVLVVTGSRTHDTLAKWMSDSTKQKVSLCEKLGLDSKKPILLSALPPDLLYALGGRPSCDFTTYRDLVEFWISSLRHSTDANIIVGLHPSAKRENFSYIETLGASISDQPIAELIPVCDYYVASISATIQWAIACGKPVINYDVYRYRYTDYLGVKGVLATEEQDEFRRLLQKMATDEAFREEIAGFQRADAPRWGILDGKAGERILALFQRMVDRRH